VKTRPIELKSLADGALARAELFICEACGGELFLIYQIEGHKHPHLQCAECGASYCTGEEEWAVIPPPADTSNWKCRGCGCTNETPCLTGGEPCSWAEKDLCSACAANPERRLLPPGDAEFRL